MSTKDKLYLAKEKVDIRFVNVVRQLNLDWTLVSPGKVDITFVTDTWQLKTYIGKLTSDVSLKKGKIILKN